MIVVSPTLSMKDYGKGWELHHSYLGLNKDGFLVMKTAVTFHTSIRMVVLAAMDKEAGQCTELPQIIETLNRVAEEFRGVTL